MPHKMEMLTSWNAFSMQRLINDYLSSHTCTLMTVTMSSQKQDNRMAHLGSNAF